MRKILPSLLLIFLLLSGCAGEEAPPTTVETTAPPATAYLENSQIEQDTKGAVKGYALEGKVDWIAPVPDGVLVAQCGEQTTLTVLSGEEGTQAATAVLPFTLEADGPWRMTGVGLWYYNDAQSEAVLLDGSLAEVNRIHMPEDLSGTPVFSQDGAAIYYCAGQTIRAIDANAKTTRPVRVNSCQEQVLLGCWLTEDILGCRMQRTTGEWTTLYISGKDGKVVRENSTLLQLYSWEDRWFAVQQEGVLTRYLYSLPDGTLRQLSISGGSTHAALSLGGILHTTVNGEAARLDFYKLSTGERTASLSLPEKSEITGIAPAQDGLWLLTGEGKLLHWNMAASAVREETTYSAIVYTAQNPDLAGLEMCTQRAEDLGKAHGVTIRINDRALLSNDAFELQPEYQPQAINSALDALETELKKFPDKFLYKSVAGMIRVCIVRSIGGKVTSAYHWYDGDPFIILSVGVDMEEAFLSAFSYVLDVHVLGNSALVDSWTTLNPKDFVYGTENTIMAFLEGENRAFASRQGMQSVVDDRASVFYYAMLADNKEMFQTKTMQSKLLLLCRGIRDAWRLEQKPDTYPWEQYLNESLAYTGQS